MQNKSSIQENKIPTIGIIGGGNAGLQLLQQFYESTSTKIGYVMDIDPDAPAFEFARAANIPIFTDLKIALSNHTDFIFEITGSPKVVEMIQEYLDENQSDTHLVTHEMSYVMTITIEEHNQQIKERVVTDILAIKHEIEASLSSINKMVKDIEKISTDTHMLSLNARIEAARVGEQGKGFGVVAQEVGKSASNVQETAQNIREFSAKIGTIADQIETSLQNLS